MEDLERGVIEARACGRSHGTIDVPAASVAPDLGRFGRVALVAIITLLVLQVGWAGYRAFPVQVSYIYPGYIFEPTDRRLVAGYADQVVVAVALDSGETLRDSDHVASRYRFRVLTELKGGSGQQQILVTQPHVDVSGKFVTLINGVQPIQARHRYVLALIEGEQGELSLLSGPRSPERAESGAGVVDRWRDAVRHQQWPTGVPRR